MFYSVIICHHKLFIIKKVHFGVKFTLYVFDVCIDLCLKVSKFLVHFHPTIFFLLGHKIIQYFAFFFHFFLVERKSVLKSIKLCPKLYNFRFEFIDFIFDVSWWWRFISFFSFELAYFDDFIDIFLLNLKLVQPLINFWQRIVQVGLQKLTYKIFIFFNTYWNSFPNWWFFFIL